MSMNAGNTMNDELSNQIELRKQREASETRLVPTPPEVSDFDRLERTFTSLGMETFARSGDDGIVIMEVHQGDRIQTFFFNLDGSVRPS